MRKQALQFVVRWLANSIGVWLAGSFFHIVDYRSSWVVVICGGFVLALLNALVKPFLVIFTLPAIALSLGLFMIIINGAIVYMAAFLYGPLDVASFPEAVLAGMLISLLNYIVNIVLEARNKS